MSKWQPIETAPKDGTDILVYAPDGDPTIYVCSWHVASYKNKDGSVIEYWRESGGELYFGWNATHWMPLPEQPT